MLQFAYREFPGGRLLLKISGARRTNQRRTSGLDLRQGPQQLPSHPGPGSRFHRPDWSRETSYCWLNGLFPVLARTFAANGQKAGSDRSPVRTTAGQPAECGAAGWRWASRRRGIGSMEFKQFEASRSNQTDAERCSICGPWDQQIRCGSAFRVSSQKSEQSLGTSPTISVISEFVRVARACQWQCQRSL